MNEQGYILRGSRKELPIFVAGDASDWHYNQAIVASGEGCQAAMDANKFLSLTNDELELQ